jgi:hypothetical protein
MFLFSVDISCYNLMFTFTTPNCSDDDSEPILGQWFEETLSPGEAQAVEPPAVSGAVGTSDADGTTSKQSRRHSSTDSIGQLPDRKEPDAVS